MVTPLDEFWFAIGISAVIAGLRMAKVKWSNNPNWNKHVINLIEWILILFIPIVALPSAIAHAQTIYSDIHWGLFFTPYIVAIICLFYVVLYNNEQYSTADKRLVYPTFGIVVAFWIFLAFQIFFLMKERGAI